MNYFQTLCLAFFLFLNCNQEAPKLVNVTSNTGDKPFQFKAELVVDKLDQAWGMAFLPDGSMLISEKKGDLIHFKNGVKTLISNVPEIIVQGQGGFMDIQLDPDYKIRVGFIFLTLQILKKIIKVQIQLLLELN